MQFSLRSLWGFLTLQCVVGVIVASSHRSTATITLPISSAALVWCFIVAHRCESLARRIGVILVISGWGLFLNSLFLPATDAFQEFGEAPGTPASGWVVMFGESAGALVTVALALAVGEPPIGRQHLASPFWLLPLPAMNLLALLAPAVVKMRNGPLFIFAASSLSTVAPFFFPSEYIGHRFFGYYLWEASFLVTAAGAGVLWHHVRRSRAAEQ